MPGEFKKRVKEKVKEIQQEVYIKDEVLQKIVGLFLSIKEERFSRPPRGILFYGPPGTGKTLLMKTLANKLGILEPITIGGPEIISQYYGKSEARLRQIFELEAKERAEEKNLAIIFIDELDSLAPRRDLTKGELEPRLVGQLLSLMDGLGRKKSKGHVVVIGSTNRPEALDPALRRPGRFDFEIEFDPPSIDERKEILKIVLNNYASGRYSDVNFDEIAEQTIGFTGADMLQLVNESLLQAALEDQDKITQKDLKKAKNSVKPSALREFNLAEPKDRRDEITEKQIVDKIEQIADEFSKNFHFKGILLPRPVLPNADKIASTMAYIVSKSLNCPYLVAVATHFKSRWFGETENSIRQFFERIKRSQPCVVYIEDISAIATPTDEQLRGAISELWYHFKELSDSNAEVLLLCSATDGVDSQVKTYLEELER